MADLLPIILASISLVAGVVLAHGVLRRMYLLQRLRTAYLEVPRDPATGLLDRRACLQVVAAEVNRARRSGGSVWVALVTVVMGDADRVGRILCDSLRVPEVGCRLADSVLCVVRPGLGDAQRDDLLGRISGAAPHARLAIGEATWRSVEDGDAADLLRRATAMREVPS